MGLTYSYSSRLRIGGIIGIGLGAISDNPLLVLVFGSSFAGMAKVLESILG